MSSTREARLLVAGGLTITEAPRWHDGALWFSDFFTRRVLRLDPSRDQADTVCEVAGRPSGLGFMPDGTLRVVSMDDCRLLSWNGRSLETVAGFGDLVSGPGNDMAIDRDGVAYVGNFGVDPAHPDIASPTALLRIDAGGEVEIAADDVVFPNGIVIDERADQLLVVETYRCRITAFPLEEGALGERFVWAEFAADPGSYDIPKITPTLPMVPDGIAQDAEGMLWVADAKGHGASRVDRAGHVVDFVETGDLSVYSVEIGGPDGHDLYLCCAPPVETVDTAVAMRGAVLHARVEVGAIGS